VGGERMTELMQRRRALMGVQSGNIPQLIPDQTHTFTTDGLTVTITDGHHIKLDFTSGIGTDGFINISDMSKNGASVASRGTNINNIADTLVNFPAGSSATITVSNFTKTPGEVLVSENGEIAVGFRKKSSNVTAIGGVGYRPKNNIVQSNTVSFTSATDASCLFIYLINTKGNVSIEFDVGLTINWHKVI
jgi:hypothetical protein